MNLNQNPKIARLISPALMLTAALILPTAAPAASETIGNGVAKAKAAQAHGEVRQAQNRRSTEVFAVDGYLQENGSECLPLRDHDGRLYILEGRTQGLRRGDHVRVVARAAYDSRCREQRATNVVVTEVVRVWADEHHRTTHFHKGQNGTFESFTQSRFAYRDRYGKDRYGRDRDGWYDRQGRYQRGNGRYDTDRDGRNTRDRDGRSDRDDRYDRDDRDVRGDRDDRDNRYGRQVDITGRIEQADNGCLVLLDRDVTIFALTGEVGRIRDGERVRVVGELGGPSRCGNQTINVRDLDRLN